MSTTDSFTQLNQFEADHVEAEFTRLSLKAFGGDAEREKYKNNTLKTMGAMQSLIDNELIRDKAFEEFNALFRSEVIELPASFSEAVEAGLESVEGASEAFQPKLAEKFQQLKEKVEGNAFLTNMVNLSLKAFEMLDKCGARVLSYHQIFHLIELAIDEARQIQAQGKNQNTVIVKFLSAIFHDAKFTRSRVDDEEQSAQALIECLEGSILSKMTSEYADYIRQYIQCDIAATIPCIITIPAEDTEDGEPKPTMVGLMDVIDSALLKQGGIEARNQDAYAPLFNEFNQKSAFDMTRTYYKEVVEAVSDNILDNAHWQAILSMPEFNFMNTSTSYEQKAMMLRLTQSLRMVGEFNQVEAKPLFAMTEAICNQQRKDVQANLPAGAGAGSGGAASRDAFEELKGKFNSETLNAFANAIAGDGNPFSEKAFAQKMQDGIGHAKRRRSSVTAISPRSLALAASRTPTPVPMSPKGRRLSSVQSLSSRDVVAVTRRVHETSDEFTPAYTADTSTCAKHSDFLVKLGEVLAKGDDTSKTLAAHLTKLAAHQEGATLTPGDLLGRMQDVMFTSYSAGSRCRKAILEEGQTTIFEDDCNGKVTVSIVADDRVIQSHIFRLNLGESLIQNIYSKTDVEFKVVSDADAAEYNAACSVSSSSTAGRVSPVDTTAVSAAPGSTLSPRSAVIARRALSATAPTNPPAAAVAGVFGVFDGATASAGAGAGAGGEMPDATNGAAKEPEGLPSPASRAGSGSVVAVERPPSGLCTRLCECFTGASQVAPGGAETGADKEDATTPR